MTAQPTICLNMIVRNEAHIIAELFDTVAPYIHSWVIVDTGSEDGTQDVIRTRMAELGIPGELHERPWKNFGHNRTEALELAQGHADYIWVMDADDLLIGTLDFSHLDSDAGLMHIQSPGVSYWRVQILRDGAPFYYAGVVHEYAECDSPYTAQRVDGDYLIQSRRLGGRNMDPLKYQRDLDLLLPEVERNPDDARSVFYVARSYNCLYDWPNAQQWYLKRAAMGGWEEEVFYSLWRAATAAEILDEPGQDIQEAYLRAWEYRPTRAEPLHDLACYFRRTGRYTRGYFFAERAAAIPMPDDTLFVSPEIYRYRSLDEQAVCASWLGRKAEALALFRRILSLSDVPAVDRKRIAGNRNALAREALEPASTYPAELAATLKAGMHDADVTVTVSAGADTAATERTVNSFLNCCTDVTEVGRFVIVDHGLSEFDRARLSDLYPFAEISSRCPAEFAAVRALVAGRFWLHLDADWRFSVPEPLISRLTEVLEAEADVVAVGVNLGDARTFTGNDENDGGEDDAAGGDWETRQHTLSVPTGASAERYVLTDTAPTGPAFYDTSRTDQLWNGERALRAATLDEIFCVTDR